jgi:Lar family restriction alleviation protein
MSALELKPCPFCGAAPLPENATGAYVFCDGCAAEGPVSHEDKNGGAHEWNRRADLPPTLSACLAHPEVKALVEAAEQATDMLKNCTFQTMYMRGQYVDREEVVARARADIARIKDAAP